jgi:hypothetical protein
LHRAPCARALSSPALTVLTIHQDLALRNTLLNFFGDSVWCRKDDEARLRFLQTDQVLYAIFDFDLSVILPAGPGTYEGRLPFLMSDVGSVDRPYDISQGEFDYDPFAWDVACLGMVFCRQFQVRSYPAYWSWDAQHLFAAPHGHDAVSSPAS